MKRELIINRLAMNNLAMERAAWLADSLTIEDIPDGIVESTCSSKTLLIEVKANRDLIKRIRAGVEILEP